MATKYDTAVKKLSPLVAARLVTYGRLRAAVSSLMDSFPEDEPCRYDHHDYCQEHFLHDAPCPVGEIHKLLKELDE